MLLRIDLTDSLFKNNPESIKERLEKLKYFFNIFKINYVLILYDFMVFH